MHETSWHRAAAGPLLSVLSASALLAVPALRGNTLSAQVLPFRTDIESRTSEECDPWTPTEQPGERAKEAADELASDAERALVLGDLKRARRLYEQASELDASDSELHYGLGRVLELIGDRTAAIEAYCRAASTDLDGDGPLRDALQREDSLRASFREDVSPSARASFVRAAHAAARGDMSDAARQFGRAEDVAPEWPSAVYNHGVALDRAGREAEAMERFAHYLELAPAGADAVAVSRRIAQLEIGRRRASTDRGVALGLGLLAPGLGQVYSGRPRVGLVVLGAAAGAVATGLMVREVDVGCLATSEGATCPAEQVLSRNTRHPLLTGSLIAAGAITVIGALDAWLHAGPGFDGPTRGTTASHDRLLDKASRISVTRESGVQVALVRVHLW